MMYLLLVSLFFLLSLGGSEITKGGRQAEGPETTRVVYGWHMFFLPEQERQQSQARSLLLVVMFDTTLSFLI